MKKFEKIIITCEGDNWTKEDVETFYEALNSKNKYIFMKNKLKFSVTRVL